jgi:diguanylate cyclase (GGDEF)-like protein/PAS domain S-box-containing protein
MGMEGDELYREAFARLPVATIVVDASGRISEASDALFALIGREMTGRDASELLAPGDRDRPWEASGPSFTVERRCRLAGGRVAPVEIAGALVSGGRLVAQLREVPERDHDALTGLPERARFDDVLGRHVSGIQRYGAEGALVLVGLDGLLRLDDVAGDRALIAAARALERRLRSTDVVTRAGDLFRVLLPRGTAAEALVVARDLRDAVSAVTGLTCSISVAPFEDPDDPVAASRRARTAVDVVRRAGGDGVAAALPSASAA